MRAIYWFRNDLRLNDNLSLNLALEKSGEILFVYIHDFANKTTYPWDLLSIGRHRKLFLSQGLTELKKNLSEYGHQLNVYTDNSVIVLSNLVKKYQIDTIYCESIKAPDEIKQIELLKDMKINILAVWHSSLFMQDQLPFNVKELPNAFTDFRKAIELGDIKPSEPVYLSSNIFKVKAIKDNQPVVLDIYAHDYNKSSFPITHKNFMGGEKSGISYLKKYFQTKKPEIYKKTRNELMGVNFSTKFSPWLSMGYVSARQIFYFLDEYENTVTKNESTYWIFFELLWRDYFRFIIDKFGRKIFYKQGLNFFKIEIKHSSRNFNLWKNGETSNKFINAGMTELKETGFLSNRMRQIVASYLINELNCDWRAGAAWFEYQLLDYDVYSNHCNWAYIAGCGTDPRGGRHFNVKKQRETYDPHAKYENFWSH
jgi:deoxyribodipyrimidine photo-lyase